MVLPTCRPRPARRTSTLLVLLVSGCASYEPAPIDLDRLPHAYAERRLDEPALGRFASTFLGRDAATWPPTALDLPALQAIALFHRPELPAARARLAQAEAAHEVAGEWQNPRLALGPGVVGNPAGAIRWLASVGLTFPLELFGQRGARVEAAASEITAARIEVALADQAIRAEVVERAFAVEQQRRLAALAEELVALRRMAVTLAEVRAAAGAADASAGTTARAAAQRAALASATSHREAEAAGAALAAAVGMPPAALAGLPLQLPPTALPELEPAAGERLAATAARQRLDIAAAMCRYAQSEAQLRLEIARQWPDLELGPGYEYDQGLQKYRIDLGWTLPLFHDNGAQIERATAARTAAAAVVEATQARAITDVATALDQFARQRHELTAAEALAATTAAAVAMARQRAELGAEDQGAVITASIDDLDARSALLQQQHDARTAWLRLELALQQPVGEGLLAWQHAVPEVAP